MSRRKELRREAQQERRKCATAADLERLDRHGRRLPSDWPQFVRATHRAKKAGKELSDAQIRVLLSDIIEVSWEKAHPILWSIRQSGEFKRWRLQLAAHPGPESKLPPEILLLGMILAAELHGYIHRTIVCQIVNGMDSRIWLEAGMCDRTTRTPVSFNVIERQLQRVENFPVGRDDQIAPDEQTERQLQPVENFPQIARTPHCLP